MIPPFCNHSTSGKQSMRCVSSESFPSHNHEIRRIQHTMNRSKVVDADVSSSKAERKLALKRIRDRRSQQAMRDRQKREIIHLREQVAQLSQLVGVPDHGAPDASPSPLRQAIHEPQHSPGSANPQGLSYLEAQVHHNLPHLTESPNYATLVSPGASPNHAPDSRAVISPTASSAAYSSSDPRPSSSYGNGSRIVIGASVLQTWSARTDECSESSFLSAALTTRDGWGNSCAPLVLSDCHNHFPRTLFPPTCPADRIMQPFIDKNQQLLATFRRARSSGAESDTQYHSAVDKIKTSITNVATDVLATYVEMQTLPKKIACLFSITKILNVLKTIPSTPPQQVASLRVHTFLTKRSGSCFKQEKHSKTCPYGSAPVQRSLRYPTPRGSTVCSGKYRTGNRHVESQFIDSFCARRNLTRIGNVQAQSSGLPCPSSRNILRRVYNSIPVV